MKPTPLEDHRQRIANGWASALTLWQPWASFMVVGSPPLKVHETRPWRTGWAGTLMIHAAKSEPRDAREAVLEDPDLASLIRQELLPAYADRIEPGLGIMDVTASVLDALPRGDVVGVVRLTRCVPTDWIRDRVTPADRALGDWTDGRYAWQATNAVQIPEPVPATGRQGLWRPGPELIAAVLDALPNGG